MISRSGPVAYSAAGMMWSVEERSAVRRPVALNNRRVPIRWQVVYPRLASPIEQRWNVRRSDVVPEESVWIKQHLRSQQASDAMRIFRAEARFGTVSIQALDESKTAYAIKSSVGSEDY
jgi:hypothetical protein